MCCSFDCEYVVPKPETSTGQVSGKQKSLFGLRGTASLLVLVEVDSTGMQSRIHFSVSVGTDDRPPYVAAQERTEHAAVDEPVSCGRKNAPQATQTDPPARDKNDCMTVKVEQNGSGSDATLNDVKERDGSEFSKWVEIEDAAALKRKAVYVADEDAARPVLSRAVASVDPKYHGILHFLTAPLDWCSIWSGSTSGSERRVPHWELYDDLCSSSDVELHLFPSPFHPKPLAPLLCVSDEANVIPLMCSALHQRRALGMGVPIVGILLPRVGSTCEVLFGWVEKEPRAGRTLVRCVPLECLLLPEMTQGWVAQDTHLCEGSFVADTDCLRLGTAVQRLLSRGVSGFAASAGRSSLCEDVPRQL